MNEEKSLPVLPPSRVRDRELWVGVFVILGVVGILTALFTLTNASFFRGRYIVYTEVSNAGGIRRGDPVQMRGVNIGRVIHFQIAPTGVTINLEIEGEYTIPSDSQVLLRSTGLLGGMVANVIPGTSTQNARWGDMLSGSVEKGIFDQAGELQDQADKTLRQFQSLLDAQTIKNIHEGSDDLKNLLRQLNETTAEQRDQFAAITKSLRRSAETLEKTVSGPEVDRSVKRIDELIGTLDTTATTLDRSSRSVESILARIDKGEGSLGKLTRDEALYNNVSEAAASVKKAADAFASLAKDIQNQPKKYVRLSLF